MKFKQKSFRKIPNILAHLKGQFLLGIQITQLSSVQIEKISDRSTWDNGDSFLPNRVGKFSRVNADGKDDVWLFTSSLPGVQGIYLANEVCYSNQIYCHMVIMCLTIMCS